MTQHRRHVAAVVGAKSASEAILAAAEGIGAGLIDAGFRVATGWLGGAMTAASRGARRASTRGSQELSPRQRPAEGGGPRTARSGS